MNRHLYIAIVASCIASLLLTCGCSSNSKADFSKSSKASTASQTENQEQTVSGDKQTQSATSASDDSETPKVSTPYPTNTEISYGFLDYQMFDKYWTNGTFRCGTDFNEGDYYIFSIWGSAAMYDVSDTIDGFTYSDYRVLRKISITEGQYIMIDYGGLLVSADEVDENNWKKYGVFLVGTDLPAGDYKITSLTDTINTELYNVQGVSGGYQVSNSTPDSEPNDCCFLYETQAYISVKDGQYVTINDAQMVLVGSETSSSQQSNEIESTESDSVTDTTNDVISDSNATEEAYNTACSLTMSDLDEKTSFTGTTKYYYKGLIIQTEDEEWLLSSLNKEKSLNQGALYRTIATYLEGFQMGINNGDSYCEIMCGFEWTSKSDFEPYATNASEFIVTENQLKAIMEKLENMTSVQGDFDFDSGKLGKYSIDISDLTACANEMQISEEMLGYIFGMLDEYAVDITFDSNSCHIEYES